MYKTDKATKITIANTRIIWDMSMQTKLVPFPATFLHYCFFYKETYNKENMKKNN